MPSPVYEAETVGRPPYLKHQEPCSGVRTFSFANLFYLDEDFFDMDLKYILIHGG